MKTLKKRWKKNRIMKNRIFSVVFSVLFAVALLAGVIKIGQFSRAADTLEILPGASNESIAGNSGNPYLMEGMRLQLRLGSSGEMYNDVSIYRVDWQSSNDAVISVEAIPGSNNLMTNVVAQSPGVATITVTVTDLRNDSTAATAAADVEVKFAVDTTKDDSKFLNVEDPENKSLVLHVNDEVDMQLTFGDAADAQWTSQNEDVFEVGQFDGHLKATGAGRALLMVSYTPDGSTTTYTSTLMVYVIPSVSLTEDGLKSTALADVKVSNKDYIYTDALFGTTGTENLSDKIIWIIKQNGIVIEDSRGGIESDLISLVPLSNTSNVLEVRAKAGTYDIEFYAYGTYVDEENNIAKSFGNGYVTKMTRMSVYAEFDNYYKTLIVGDSYNIAKALNITLEDLNTYFYAPQLTVDGADASNYATYDSLSGIVTTKQTGTVKIDLKGNNSYASSWFRQVTKNYNGNIDYQITLEIINTISLSNSSLTLFVGDEYQLTANTTAEYDGEISWRSSDTKFVTVNENGLVKAVRVTEEDITVTVTQSMDDGKEMKATCLVKVISAPTSLKLSQESISLQANGGTATLMATIKPSANGVKLTWTVIDEKVVTKSESTDTMSVVLTGKTAGETTVLCQYVKGDKVLLSAQCVVKVHAQITSVSLNYSEYKVPLDRGTITDLKAIYTPKEATGLFEWKSNNETVAVVTGDGPQPTIQLKSAGTAIISARPIYTTGGLMAECKLIVSQSPTGIKFTKASYTLELSDEKNNMAVVESVLSPANAETTLRWESDDDSIAFVDQNGKVTARSPGKTFIRATTDNGFYDRAEVTVTLAASGINVKSKNITINATDKYDLEPKPIPANSTETVFSWTTWNAAVATVNENGVITGVSAGTTFVYGVTKKGSLVMVQVTVKDKVGSLTLNAKTKTVVIGDTAQLTANILPTNATNKKVTWVSSDPSICTVSATGLLKGKKGGSVIVTCTSQDNKACSDTCLVTVVEPVMDLFLNKSSYILGYHKYYTLKATVKKNTASNPKLKWTTTNKKIVTVTSKGKIYGKKLGKVKVKVTTTDVSKLTATCTVRVIRQVTSISLNQDTMTIVEGRRKRLKAAIKPKKATYKTAKFTSNNTEIAIVNSKGWVTGRHPGECIITAQAKDNSKKKAICYVKVIEAVPATSIVLSSSNITLRQGQKEQLPYTVLPYNHTDSLKFASDNKSVATISSSGMITGKKAGVTEVTVTSTSGKQAKATVTVIGFNRTSFSMKQYDTETVYLEGVSSNILWWSSNKNVATVSGSGATGNIVARKKGTCYIYAKYNGVTVTAKVKVRSLK
ncbi:MAG: Ig-like domain-containing protein [Lachnospiraceae bacterium]|nr:Ig-like domain-containing protein [Lachnospiraceae bacterium]